MMDVSVNPQGTLTIITLTSDSAIRWVEERVEVEDYQWVGENSFVVEHRYTSDLIDGMLDAGLEVG